MSRPSTCARSPVVHALSRSGAGGPGADATTIWLFREALLEAGLIDKLFARFGQPRRHSKNFAERVAEIRAQLAASQRRQPCFGFDGDRRLLARARAIVQRCHGAFGHGPFYATLNGLMMEAERSAYR